MPRQNWTGSMHICLKHTHHAQQIATLILHVWATNTKDASNMCTLLFRAHIFNLIEQNVFFLKQLRTSQQGNMTAEMSKSVYCEPWCVHFPHAALSLLFCPEQPTQSRFLRSLIRFPEHPYRSDVMVAKPPRRGQARSPVADRRRHSAHEEPGDGDQPAQDAQPSGAQPSGEVQPSESAAQPSEATDSGSPPQQAVLESWFRNLTQQARKRLLETQPAESSKPASEPEQPRRSSPLSRRSPPHRRPSLSLGHKASASSPQAPASQGTRRHREPSQPSALVTGSTQPLLKSLIHLLVRVLLQSYTESNLSFCRAKRNFFLVKLCTACSSLKQHFHALVLFQLDEGFFNPLLKSIQIERRLVLTSLRL